jgi:hypothetical protein
MAQDNSDLFAGLLMNGKIQPGGADTAAMDEKGRDIDNSDLFAGLLLNGKLVGGGGQSEIPVAQPQQLAPTPDMTKMEMATGAANIMASGVTGAAEDIAGGLSMLGGTLLGVGNDRAVETGNALMDRIPDIPIGEDAQRIIAGVSGMYNASPDLVKTLFLSIQGLSDRGGKIGKAVGDPIGLGDTLGSIGTAVPAALEMVAGGGLSGATARGAKNMGESMVPGPELRQEAFGTAMAPLGQKIDRARAGRQRLSGKDVTIRESLETNRVDRDAAPFKLTDQGRQIPDPLGEKALEQGFDGGLIDTLKNATGVTAKRLNEMVDIRQEGRRDPVLESRKRATSVGGRSLIQRIDYIRKTNQRAGKELDRTTNELKGQSIDLDAVTGSFIDDLAELDIGLDIRKWMKQAPEDRKLDFSESILADNPAARAILTSVAKRAAADYGKGRPDALMAHKLKRMIDDQVVYGKSASGLQGDAVRVVKRLRAGIDAVLDNKFPEYDAANTAYADTIKIISELQRLGGKQIDLSSTRADDSAGLLMRGIMSNNRSSNALIEAMDMTEEVAAKYGGQFDDDLPTLAYFANALDKGFGASGATSFQGQVGSGVVEGATDLAIDMAIPAGGRAVFGGIKRLMNKKGKEPSEAERFDTLRKLIDQQSAYNEPTKKQVKGTQVRVR